MKILQNAATLQHYEFLQNCSRLIARLGKKSVRLVIGTMRNEQLHREFNVWIRNIRMSHTTRFLICIQIFVFLKLITHSSAAYYPTLVQTTQARLIHLIAGDIQHNGFFPQPIRSVQSDNHKCLVDIQRPYVVLESGVAEQRLVKRKVQQHMWSIENQDSRAKNINTTNIFKRPRAGTRPRTRSSKPKN